MYLKILHRHAYGDQLIAEGSQEHIRWQFFTQIFFLLHEMIHQLHFGENCFVKELRSHYNPQNVCINIAIF